MYVVQSYELPGGALLEDTAARVMPWIEFLLGIFLALGLWMKGVLRMLLILVGAFIFVVGQALIRGLPITECGCFGGLVSFPPRVLLMFDAALLFLAGLLARKEERANVFSLDRYFNE